MAVVAVNPGLRPPGAAVPQLGAGSTGTVSTTATARPALLFECVNCRHKAVICPFYSPTMLTRIGREVFQEIRKHGDLSVDEAAAAIGKGRQIVYRIEGEKRQLLTADQEDRLVRRANLSREAFVQIMCKVLSKFLGRPVTIAPKGRYLPSSPLARDAALFVFFEDRLPPGLKARIRTKLNNARIMEAAVDETASQCEMEVHDLVQAVVGPVALKDLDLDEDED